MTLSRVKEGASVTMSGVVAGCRLRGRLAAMGLFPGVEMTVLHSAAAGPVLVAVNGSRLALGRRMADRIEVKAR